MRRIFVLLCLGIGGFLVIGACQKEGKPKEIDKPVEEVPIWEAGPQRGGFAKGKKNELDFNASAFGFFARSPLEGLIVIRIFTESVEGYRREDITFGALSWDVKNYLLTSKEPLDLELEKEVTISYYTLIDGGDVSGDTYVLDNTFDENSLKIDSIDKENRVVKGVFNVRFKNEDKDNKSDPRNPDLVTFEEIQFEAKISE